MEARTGVLEIAKDVMSLWTDLRTRYGLLRPGLTYMYDDIGNRASEIGEHELPVRPHEPAESLSSLSVS